MLLSNHSAVWLVLCLILRSHASNNRCEEEKCDAQRPSAEAERQVERLQRYADLLPPNELRSRYIVTVNELLAKSDANSARFVARSGVKHGAFATIWQRPEAFTFPGLKSSPFLDSAVPCLTPFPTTQPPSDTQPQPHVAWLGQEYPVVALLEKSHATIVKEAHGALSELWSRVPEKLHAKGSSWSHIPLYFSNGTGWTTFSKRFPTIQRLLQDLQIPPTGVVSLSRVQAGSRILPHCGPSNVRARIHLTLEATPGFELKVAEEIRTWQTGKAFVFDDSYEHEVRGPPLASGKATRSVLIVDQWHNSLSPDARAQATQRLRDAGY